MWMVTAWAVLVVMVGLLMVTFYRWFVCLTTSGLDFFGGSDDQEAVARVTAIFALGGCLAGGCLAVFAVGDQAVDSVAHNFNYRDRRCGCQRQSLDLFQMFWFATDPTLARPN